MLYLVKFERVGKSINIPNEDGTFKNPILAGLESKDIYHLYDTHTESIIKGDAKFVIKLITTHDMKAANIYLDSKGIQLKEWPHGIKRYSNNKEDRESINILISKVDGQEFKLFDKTYNTICVSENDLKKLIRWGYVANCEYTIEDGVENYRSIDTCNIETTQEFTDYIKQEYSKFIAKVNLLGLRISFDYTIENEEVKIQEYTGSSSRVIIPSFVNTLCNGSFSRRGIRELALNNGLKYIGNHCFSHNIIRHIKLPETIKFIGIDAFEYGAVYGANYQRILKRMYPNALIL